jgi:poly-gamma-glutamate synthesis protein (capsule biosynthesis protein)
VPHTDEIRLLLCGDVMLGRGVDQILPHPGDPALPRSLVRNRHAGLNVALAQLKHGAIPVQRDFGYVWGEALADFAAWRPDLRIINLETAITARGAPWTTKLIHYRMHPQNTGVLEAAGIDFCALANNHTLDYGHEGLADTLTALERAGVRHAGAGADRRQAGAPAVIELPGKGRVLIVSLATPSSFVPRAWAAAAETPGINLVGVNEGWVAEIRRRLAEVRRSDDLVVASIHWGDNYVHGVDDAHRRFAQRLIDEAGVDLIHGHSSHHVRGIEVHSGRLVLYGCGDLINDYEGTLKTPPRLALRPDLGLIYLARFAADRRFLGLEMRPTRIHRLQVRRAGPQDAQHLRALLNREGAPLGTEVEEKEGVLCLKWPREAPGGASAGTQ